MEKIKHYLTYLTYLLCKDCDTGCSVDERNRYKKIAGMRECSKCKMLSIFPKAPKSVVICFDCKKS